MNSKPVCSRTSSDRPLFRACHGHATGHHFMKTTAEDRKEKSTRVSAKRKFLHTDSSSSTVQHPWKLAVATDNPLMQKGTLPPLLSTSSSSVKHHRRPHSLSGAPPLQVFSDGDLHGQQQKSCTSLSPNIITAGDAAADDATSKADSLLKERRHRCTPPCLRDTTNIAPRNARKQQQSSCCNVSAEVVALKETLRTERETLGLLQAELEEERNAANTAASEAMAMIARLQEEKAAVLMDARQFKRMAEEREIHNQEAIGLLKEILLNKEEENLALEHELEACRRMFLALEGGDGRDNGNNNNIGTCVSKLELVNGDFIDHMDSSSAENKWRRRRNFKLLISDDIRNDLTSCFDQTSEDIPHQKIQIGVAASELTDRKNCQSADSSMRFIAASSAADMVCNDDDDDDHDPHLNPISNAAVKPPISVEKTVVLHKIPSEIEEKVNINNNNHSATTTLLWDRIMNLEHRLEVFGIGQCSEEEIHHFRDNYSQQTTSERPSKIQCREVSGCRISASSKQTPDVCGEARIEGRDGYDGGAFINPETPCNRDAQDVATEEMHDVYEIEHPHQSTIQKQKQCSGALAGPRRRTLQSSPELIAPDLELMDVQSYASSPLLLRPPDVAAAVSVGQIQRLTARLQCLETERIRMNEAIVALQKENQELKAFQRIAQEFHQLKSLTGYYDPCGKDLRSNQSLLSLFTGFLSCLRNGAADRIGRTCIAPSDSDSAHENKHTTGLSYILEKSPQLLRTGAVMVRGRKVNVPNVG